MSWPGSDSSSPTTVDLDSRCDGDGDEDGDLPDTGAQDSPFLLGLGLVLTTAGYIVSWRHRPGRSR